MIDQVNVSKGSSIFTRPPAPTWGKTLNSEKAKNQTPLNRRESSPTYIRISTKIRYYLLIPKRHKSIGIYSSLN